MTASFLFFCAEISKPEALRKGFVRKRKNPFSISDARINELYDKYFSNISPNDKSFDFKADPDDFEEIVYLLRAHFQLWIEIQGENILIYREFSERFRLTKEVNTENHPHTPIVIPAGTIMELAADSYGVVNYGKGIPLTGKILSENKNDSDTSKPYLQINYPFIKAIY